jgi:hypothetical protein
MRTSDLFSHDLKAGVSDLARDHRDLYSVRSFTERPKG